MTAPGGEGDGQGFAARHWPWLLIVFGAAELWHYHGGQGGNTLAGIAGFTGFGWLAWALIIKPRL